MRAREWNWSAGLLTIGLLGAFTPAGLRPRAVTPPRTILPRWCRPPDTGPSQVALREAARLRGQAIQQVDEQCTALEAWDPSLDTDRPPALRRQLMADDRGGWLRRARAVAQQALVLARTPHQRRRALSFLAFLECAAGDHRAELRHVRCLLEMDPGDPHARERLQLARHCLDQPPQP
jgi:hypothetical protein